MPVAELTFPSRLLAGGGPGSPDARVLRAMAAPLIGQFDPNFTAIMDDVMELARCTFLTRNARCFPVSGLAAAGLEALVNTLVEPGDRVAIGGEPGFMTETADVATRYGAEVLDVDDVLSGKSAKLVVVPLGEAVGELAAACRVRGARLIVEATQALGACEVRVDAWGIDACVAGVDYALGAPSGLALVTYTSEVEALMHARHAPPRTSYLDLLQLQAYWSPERLNHHTAPTSLVYGLREALHLLHHSGLEHSWTQHHRVGHALRAGLAALGLEVGGDSPYAVVRLPADLDEVSARKQLLEVFGVHVRPIAPQSWRMGLLGADARLDAVTRVLSGVEHVLQKSGAVDAALDAYARA
jgi:(S)-ureidoglycine-glyoxylate aminotransferase